MYFSYYNANNIRFKQNYQPTIHRFNRVPVDDGQDQSGLSLKPFKSQVNYYTAHHPC